jgi:hypothetical protein
MSRVCAHGGRVSYRPNLVVLAAALSAGVAAFWIGPNPAAAQMVYGWTCSGHIFYTEQERDAWREANPVGPNGVPIQCMMEPVPARPRAQVPAPTKPTALPQTRIFPALPPTIGNQAQRNFWYLNCQGQRFVIGSSEEKGCSTTFDVLMGRIRNPSVTVGSSPPPQYPPQGRAGEPGRLVGGTGPTGRSGPTQVARPEGVGSGALDARGNPCVQISPVQRTRQFCNSAGRCFDKLNWTATNICPVPMWFRWKIYDKYDKPSYGWTGGTGLKPGQSRTIGCSEVDQCEGYSAQWEAN